jgi:hypothetical protein
MAMDGLFQERLQERCSLLETRCIYHSCAMAWEEARDELQPEEA